MKIAVFGDSFGVQKNEDKFDSWVSLLAKHFEIHNYCESGIGEYKILKKIQTVDLSCYNKILITHTSPNRIYVKYNPLHITSKYHKNCDILYADIEKNSDEFSVAGQMYFKHIFDFEYANDIHNMICREINRLVAHADPIHITHFDYTDLYNFAGLINFHRLFLKNKGTVGHYNKEGNIKIFETIMQRLTL